jgi:hypothetical protein
LRTPGRVLGVVVVILALGCATRGDWISETLTLVDLSGTWEGTVTAAPAHGRTTRTIRLVLKQTGARVTGELDGGWTGWLRAPVEGVVSGEAFTFRGAEIQGEMTVSGVEMKGRADGYYCPCTIVLDRVGDARER